MAPIGKGAHQVGVAQQLHGVEEGRRDDGHPPAAPDARQRRIDETLWVAATRYDDVGGRQPALDVQAPDRGGMVAPHQHRIGKAPSGSLRSEAPKKAATAIRLAFGCVAMLVFFVHHMAGRINVDTVVNLVHRDLRRALRRLTLPEPEPAAPPSEPWTACDTAGLDRQGYLQRLDDDALADWLTRAVLTCASSPGQETMYFPARPLAEASDAAPGLGPALVAATALGPSRTGAEDLEFGVRQLVDVAVRTLSPGINDPQTAVAVLDRLGAVLCDLAGRGLPDGRRLRDGGVVLSRPAVTYDGLTDAMFTIVRQNAESSASVVIRLQEVLCAVARVEGRSDRRATLLRHVDMALEAARRGDLEPAALKAVAQRDADIRAALASRLATA